MIAYTEKLGFDVLTAPIAEVDRRTLSQAWYSALHVTNADGRQPSCSRSNVVPFRKREAAMQERNPHLRLTSEPVRSIRALRAREGRVDGEMWVERRAPHVLLARRIEKVLFDRPMRQAAFTLAVESGRVRLSVRSIGTRVHLVAVCTPSARENVARALQQVRFSFARRGVVFAGSLREHVQ